MNIDIKTTDITPVRNAYSYIARRLGGDKTASRYQEATFDIQEEINFHYRPLWNPDVEIFDPRHTRIVMADWYALLDPRQYYYGTYTQTRAKQQDAAERSIDFIERRDMLASLDDSLRQLLIDVLLPLRHAEWAANMNNMYITSYGYGAAVTNCAMFAATDRLGIAQHLTRIGLLLGRNQPSCLDEAKSAWINAPYWQGLRRYLEDSFVVKDWFELHVLQNLVLDGLLYPLVYQRFEDRFSKRGGVAVAVLTEFIQECHDENVRWIDASIKVAAAESAENRELLMGWLSKWLPRAEEALTPLAERALRHEGRSELQIVMDRFKERLRKIGLVSLGGGHE